MTKTDATATPLRQNVVTYAIFSYFVVYVFRSGGYVVSSFVIIVIITIIVSVYIDENRQSRKKIVFKTLRKPQQKEGFSIHT